VQVIGTLALVSDPGDHLLGLSSATSLRYVASKRRRGGCDVKISNLAYALHGSGTTRH